MTKKNILVTCAHPDDETLGLGGTLALQSLEGNNVFVLVFADGQFARDVSPKGIRHRQDQARRACSTLGINIQFLNYKDQKLDTIPTIELVCKIESVIKKLKPEIIYTHYWGDVNQDHKKVFEATQIAVRPKPMTGIRHFICFETPSSTDWGDGNFKPNLFINIEKVLKKKIDAISEYKDEMNPFPHPRSKIAIINRSQYWGSLVGINNAEAFVSVRKIE